MITPKTQAAIAVLNDIYAGGDTARTDACRLTEQDMDTLLSKLSSAGLIKLSGKGDPRDIQSYIPARNSSDVSLLDILEEFYLRYGRAAQKLGIVNYITREYLHGIKLFEL